MEFSLKFLRGPAAPRWQRTSNLGAGNRGGLGCLGCGEDNVINAAEILGAILTGKNSYQSKIVRDFRFDMETVPEL